MKKAIGYLSILAGIAIFALSFAQVRTITKITLPAGITDMYVTIAGAVILIIGAAIAFRGPARGKQASEVPIYHGNQIVGYRRVK